VVTDKNVLSQVSELADISNVTSIWAYV